MKTKKTPLSIYIHIPFCKKKCLYCDFLSAPACAKERESYVKALLREISLMAGDDMNEYEVISVFFGGGTPSLLGSSQIRRIMSAIRKGFYLCEDAEITIECNPATANAKKMQAYIAGGINRISIGLQSADDSELKKLGRIHTYKQFTDTFFAAREAGFHNINVDIMSALPGQTYESYENTLKKVIALKPEHISAYSLIIEEGTPFYEKYEELSLPDEDMERKMYHNTKRLLQKEGFMRYEISNYAKKGYECRHNLTYWTGIDYIGFGIGAASYFKGVRYKNSSDMNKYLSLMLAEKSTKVKDTAMCQVLKNRLQEEQCQLSLEERMEEFMFLGLRLTQGISVSDFKKKFGKSPEEVYGSTMEQMIKEKLLLKNKNRLYLSKKGMDLANYVMAQFLLSS